MSHSAISASKRRRLAPPQTSGERRAPFRDVVELEDERVAQPAVGTALARKHLHDDVASASSSGRSVRFHLRAMQLAALTEVRAKALAAGELPARPQPV